MSSKTKKYSGFLIVNWKDDKIRFRQTKPSKSNRSPFEIPVKANLAIEVPEFDIPEISQTLQVPKVQVKQAVSEMVDYEDEETDFPEPSEFMWRDSADLIEKIEDLMIEGDLELSSTDKLNWLRDMLRYEYSNSCREDVVQFLEDNISEVKE